MVNSKGIFTALLIPIGALWSVLSFCAAVMRIRTGVVLIPSKQPHSEILRANSPIFFCACIGVWLMMALLLGYGAVYNVRQILKRNRG